MGEQKPVDSNQVVLDNRKANASAGSATGGARASCASFGMGGLIFKIVAVLFVVGNVTALYVLHFVNRPSPTTRFSFINFAAGNGTTAKIGDVVSLSTDSKLRNGAGTTAYLNRATMSTKDTAYYEYINVAKLGTSKATYLTNLMSYRRVTSSGAKESVLTTFTVDPATKGVSISDAYDKTNNILAGDAIRGIATLSDTAAIVLTVDDSTFTYKTYVSSATIGQSGATLAKGTAKKVATGSSTNFVTRLNSNSAVVAYFEPWVSKTDYYQSVMIASVATDGTVTLSDPKRFGPANNDDTFYVNWGRPITVSSTDGSFAIPYYTSASGLCLTMSSFSTSTQTLADFTTGVCNTKVQPVYFPEGIMLSDSLMLLAFHDSSNNNVLTLVTASVTGTKAYFRSSFVFPEVAGAYDFGTTFGFSPDVSLALLSGNRVAVSVLNPSMNGRQSVKIVKYSLDSLSFKDVTPVLPVATPSFTLNLNGGTPNKAVTQRVMAVGADSIVAIHMGVRGAAAYQHVALVEAFGSPVGVLRDLRDKSKASVAISGKAQKVHTTGKGKLLKDQFYYATTAGYVATPAAGTPASVEVFTSREDPNMLVTADSKIGLGIDDDELFVSTSF